MNTVKTNKPANTAAPARKVRAKKSPTARKPAPAPKGTMLKESLASLTAENQKAAAAKVAADKAAAIKAENEHEVYKPEGGYDALAKGGYKHAAGSAFTYSILRILGAIVPAAKDGTVNSTGRPVKVSDIMKLNDSASMVNHWKKTGLADVDRAADTFKLKADGINLINERILGKSSRHAFNTTPEHCEKVYNAMLKGTRLPSYGFIPVKVSVTK